MTAARELPSAVSGLTTEVVSVTPAIAEKWLGKNVRNRHMNQRIVVRYARAMRRGEWIVNGEAIKFAVTGELLDGQHRLAAIAESGKTIKILVVRGLPSEAQNVLDTGKPRSTGDQLGIAGFPNAHNLAAVARVVIGYETGQLAAKPKPSTPEVLQLVSGNEILAFCVVQAKPVTRGCDLRPSIAGAAMYVLTKINDEKSQEFFDRLTDGANLPSGSPVLALRDRLRTVRNERTALPDEALLGLVFRAWNAWRARRTLTSLPLYNKGELIPCPEPK